MAKYRVNVTEKKKNFGSVTVEAGSEEEEEARELAEEAYSEGNVDWGGKTDFQTGDMEEV